MSDIFASQQAHLAAIAEHWLAAGAESFSIWSDGEMLASWPAETGCSAPTTAVPIQMGRVTVGELRVSGIEERLAKKHLISEAQMLARIAGLENDLEQMTSELIDTQDHLLALYDLTQAIRSHLGLRETLHSLAEVAMRVLKVQAAVTFLAPMLSHYPRPIVDDAQLVDFIREVQASGQVMVRNAPDLANGLRNLCFVPIQVRGGITAVLGLLNKSSGDFGAPDLKLARAIAEQAGAQIEHALLYQERLDQMRLNAEMELARNVQVGLLPQHCPDVRGLDIFAESHPAFQVGGDFYDFVAQPGRPLIFSVGDVAGKGISAALIMGMIHTIARSAARFIPTPMPTAVLRRTNDDLYDDFTNLSTFATTFVGQYEIEQRVLYYANAGHAPVIFCPARGAARLLEGDGVPIGVLPTTLCEDHVIDFGPGDVLIVATDGLSEARNQEGEMFGYDRLLRLAEELRGETARTIAAQLLSTIEAFSSGRSQEDDQTVVVLKGVPS